jgi:hypothetical protein
MPDEQWKSLQFIYNPTDVPYIYTHITGPSSIDVFENGVLVRSTTFDEIIDDPGPPSPPIHFDDISTGSIQFRIHRDKEPGDA